MKSEALNDQTKVASTLKGLVLCSCCESKPKERSKLAQTLFPMAHFFGVLLLVYTAWLAQPGTSLFSWHPTLMVFAFSVMMLEAILLFSPYSSLMPGADRKTKGRYHWYFQIASSVAASLGFAAIAYNKYRAGKPHFVSWHAKCGLITAVLMSFQNFAGLGLMYPTSKLLNPSGWTLAARKKTHAMYGCVVFLMATLTMVLSLYTKWFSKVAGEFVWYAFLALMTVLASVVTNQVTNEYVFKRK